MSATAPPPLVRVFVVRHADAGRPRRPAPDDHLRELDEHGRLQAGGLFEVLEPHGVGAATAVLSSDYPRCVQTVEPLASALGRRVTPEPLLREGTPLREVLGLLRGLPSDTVVCSHGDVVGDLVLWLESRVDLGGDLRWQKASTWVLDLSGGEVAAARYVKPPAV